MFTDKEHRGAFEFSDELGHLSIGPETVDNVVSAQGIEANDNDLLLSTSDKEESRNQTHNGSAYSAPLYNSSSASSLQSELAVLSPTSTGNAPPSSSAIDDLLGLGLSATSAPASSLSLLNLNSKAALDSGTFQQKWRQLPIALSKVYLAVMLLIYLFMFKI